MVHTFTSAGEEAMIHRHRTAPDLSSLLTTNAEGCANSLQNLSLKGVLPKDEAKRLRDRWLEMNKLGMLIFSDQPRLMEQPLPPHEHTFLERFEEKLILPSDEKAYCHRCALGACPADSEQWSQVRLLPMVQFCLLTNPMGMPTPFQVLKFAKALCEDKNIVTRVSWPKRLKGCLDPKDTARKVEVAWVEANLREARRYIPQKDLEGWFHFKGKHGSCSIVDVRSAESEEKLEKAEWRPAKEQVSEVNDTHLITPRMPEWFLGRDAATVVFGVSAAQFRSGLKGNGIGDIEGIILRKAEEMGFLKQVWDGGDMGRKMGSKLGGQALEFFPMG